MSHSNFKKIIYLFVLIYLISCDHTNRTNEIRTIPHWHFKFSEKNKESKFTRKMFAMIKTKLIDDYNVSEAKDDSVISGTLDMQIIFNPITRAYHRVEVNFLNRKNESMGSVKVDNHDRGKKKRNHGFFAYRAAESIAGVLKN